MKEKFNGLALSRLHNELHAQFHDEVLHIFANLPPAELSVIYNSYATAFEAEIALVDEVRKSGFTREIVLQNNLRTRIFRGFYGLVKSNIYHYTANGSKAAVSLKILFDNYGKVSRKDMDAKTAVIDDLLKELAKENRVEELALLGIGEWAVQLGAANKIFSDLMGERYREMARRPTGKLVDLRKVTDGKYRLLCSAIEYHVLISTGAAQEGLLKTVALVNAVVERYNWLLKQRVGYNLRRNKKGVNGEQGLT